MNIKLISGLLIGIFIAGSVALHNSSHDEESTGHFLNDLLIRQDNPDGKIQRVKREPVTFMVVTTLISLGLTIVGTALQMKDSFADKVEQPSEKLDLSEVKQELMIMNEKLNDLVTETRDQELIKEYNKYLRKLDVLNYTMHNYIINHNEFNQKQLVDKCKDNKMLDLIMWVDGQVRRQGSTIYEVMSRYNDPGEVKKWKELIFMRMRQAILSHFMCITMISDNLELANKTIMGIEGKHNGEAHVLKNILINLNSTFNDQMKKVQDRFNKDVIDWVKEKTKYANFGVYWFTEDLSQYLKKKYKNKNWLVISNDNRGNRFEYRDYSVAHGMVFNEEEYGYDIPRSFFVAETDAEEGFLKNKNDIEQCVSKLDQWAISISANLSSIFKTFVDKCDNKVNGLVAIVRGYEYPNWSQGLGHTADTTHTKDKELKIWEHKFTNRNGYYNYFII